MTILVDSRVGSAHYAPLLPNSVITTLEYGDMAFAGANGVTVGIEVKKLGDAVNCLYSGRLADHQIPGMRESYTVSYLIVEGLWRPEPGSGVLQSYRGELGKWGQWTDVASGNKGLTYSAFESWLTSMEILSSLRVRVTPSLNITAALVLSLYNWYQRSDHASFHTMQQVGTEALSRPTTLRRIAAQFPGVGWTRSKAVTERFRSVSAMVAATEDDWREVDGIGKVTAKKVMEVLHGGASEGEGA